MNIKLSHHGGEMNVEGLGVIRTDLYSISSSRFTEKVSGPMDSNLMSIEITDSSVQLEFSISDRVRFDLIDFMLNKLAKNPDMMEHFIIFLYNVDDEKIAFIELTDIEDVERDDNLLIVYSQINYYKTELVCM